MHNRVRLPEVPRLPQREAQQDDAQLSMHNRVRLPGYGQMESDGAFFFPVSGNTVVDFEDTAVPVR